MTRLRRRRTFLGASVVLALMLMTASGCPTDNPPAGYFVVSFLGFTAHDETDDHQLEVDGKGDEVFGAALTMRFGSEGLPVAESDNPFTVTRTPTWGDVNGQEDRLQCGTASDKGGIRSGDSCPTAEPWVIGEDEDRFILSEFWLQSGQGKVTVLPMLWEWDGGGSQNLEYLTEEPNKLVEDIGSVEFETEDKDDNGYPDGATVSFPLDIRLGDAVDRPIGIKAVVGYEDWVYVLQSLALDYELANELANDDPSGLGRGVIALRFTEGGDDRFLTGDYSLYVKIRQA